MEEGRHISSSKRLSDFAREDYDNVIKIFSSFDEVCITPYIATEVSNLIDLNGTAREVAFGVARSLFSSFTQVDTEITGDCLPDHFVYYGITDCSLIYLVTKYFVPTSDSRLCPMLYAANAKNVIQYLPIKH